MRKFIYIFLTFIFIFFSLISIGKYQSMMTSASLITGYAQVHFNNVYLYKYPSEEDTYENKYFMLEPSYFVKLLEKTNDYFYKVDYAGIIGYVLISEVEEVDETPINPYPSNIPFSINKRSNAILRSEPSTEKQLNSVIKILNSGLDNIEYLGKISGEESLYGGGNIWYYCKVTNKNGESSFGYVYANLTTNLSKIPQNEEQVVFTSSVNQASLLYLSETSQNLMILILLLPSILIIYLFIKPTKILKKEKLLK